MANDIPNACEQVQKLCPCRNLTVEPAFLHALLYCLGISARNHTQILCSVGLSAFNRSQMLRFRALKYLVWLAFQLGSTGRTS